MRYRAPACPPLEALRATAASLAPALLGCGDAGPPSAAAELFTLRDSAGIEIVESRGHAWEHGEGEGWTLGTEPLVEIGTVFGEGLDALHEVADAKRLSNGHIVVANDGSKEIRYFTAEGAPLHATGRAGNGPAEFRSVSGLLVLPGDSVLVYDRTAARFTMLDSEGRFSRTFPLGDFSLLVDAIAEAGDNTPYLSPRGLWLEGSLSDGTIALQSTSYPSPTRLTGEGLIRSETLNLRISRKGEILGTLVGRNWSLAHLGERPAPVPFSPVVFMRSRGGLLYQDAPPAFEIRVYDSEERLQRIVRRLTPLIPVTDAMWSQEIERIVQPPPADDPPANPGFYEDLRAAYEAIPKVDSLPAFQGFFVDQIGAIWVWPYWVRTPGSTRPDPIVVDRDGRVLGTVAIPEGITLYEVGADWMLVSRRDALDVEYVQLLPLDRGAGG